MKKNRPRSRRGAATVEFAVIAPVLILLVMGMIEIGRGINVQHVLVNASRAACRIAIIPGATQDEISDQVSSSVASNGITSFNLTVSPNPLESAETGDPVTVTVSVNYDDISWIPAPRFLNGATISGACSLPRE